MKVVSISHRYRPSIGGLENYCYRLSNSLRDRGHDVSIITTDESLSNDATPLAREANTTYCETTATALRNPFSVELFRRVRRSDADIYHLHSPWYLSSLEAVHAIDDTPTVMTVHGFQPMKTLLSRALEVAYRPVGRHVLNAVDRVIALGGPEERRLRSEYDVPASNVSVVPNGIHPDEHDVSQTRVEQFREKHDIDPSTPTVLFVSRLVPLKGPDVLIDALPGPLRSADLDVIVVGSGADEYVSDLEASADDRFSFLLNLPFESLQAAYHAADLFVLPTHSEGLPTVVLEAMNARLPVITSPVGALPEVLTHGTHGWLLDDPTDVGEVAEAIRYYLDRPGVRRDTGERNRARVRDKFDWETVAEDLEALYSDVADVATEPPPIGDRLR